MSPSKTFCVASVARHVAAQNWMSSKLLIFVFSLVAIVATASAGEWDFRGMQVGPKPLPFQAPRIRLTLRNIGDRVEGPYSNFPGGRIKFFASNQLDYHMIHARFLWFDGFHLADRDGKNPQSVEPDYELSTTVALAPVRFEIEGRGKGRLFADARPHYFMEGWVEPGRRPDYEIFSQPIVVEVAEPKRGELELFLRLKGQDDLLDAMAIPWGRFEDDLVPKLEALVKDHPKSSYANYARLALARRLTLGIRVSDPPTDADLVEALELLRGIDHKNFGYGDYSLALSRQILHKLQSADEEREVAAELDKTFPDSLVRLDDLAQRLTPEEWKKLNPRKPTPHKKPEAK